MKVYILQQEVMTDRGNEYINVGVYSTRQLLEEDLAELKSLEGSDVVTAVEEWEVD